MKVIKLPHAGMIIESASSRLIFDPLFSEMVEDTYELIQPVQVAPKILKKAKFDGIILSHRHNDHFDLETLKYFNRDCHIFFPKGEIIIPVLLQKMGFKHFRPIQAHIPVSFPEITIYPIPSRVDFPEFGFVLQSKKIKIWNLVDAIFTKADIDLFKRLYGIPDLAFCYYQPVRENKMCTLMEFGSFPTSYYNELLDIALATQARSIVPAAWDFVNTICPHLNQFLAPVSKQRFNQDIAERSEMPITPQIEVGDVIRLNNRKLNITRNGKYLAQLGLTRVKNPPAAKILAEAKFELQPLRDHNGTLKDLASTRKFVHTFIHREFLKILRAPESNQLIENYRKQQIRWQLDIIFADEKISSYFIDFREMKIGWCNMAIQPNYISRVGAGDLRKLYRGELSIYAFGKGGYLSAVDSTENAIKIKHDILLSILNAPLKRKLGKRVIDRIQLSKNLP